MSAESNLVASQYVPHTTDNLEFTGYYYHHNRNPFYFLFIRKDKNIYIERINEHTKNNKYVDDIVMPFDVMAKDECLKKYYDMSVMLANNSKTIYYDTYGIETKQLISTYDTDSDDDDMKPLNIRNWCISSDFVWKNLRVSKTTTKLNCYYNIDPFTFEYNIDTEKEINDFMKAINSFAKYNGISSIVESEIIANYNNKCLMADANV